MEIRREKTGARRDSVAVVLELLRVVEDLRELRKCPRGDCGVVAQGPISSRVPENILDVL